MRTPAKKGSGVSTACRERPAKRKSCLDAPGREGILILVIKGWGERKEGENKEKQHLQRDGITLYNCSFPPSVILG